MDGAEVVPVVVLAEALVASEGAALLRRDTINGLWLWAQLARLAKFSTHKNFAPYGL